MECTHGMQTLGLEMWKCRHSARMECRTWNADTLLSKDLQHRPTDRRAVARRLIIGRQGHMRARTVERAEVGQSDMMMGRLGAMRSALQRKIQLRIQRGAGGAIT